MARSGMLPPIQRPAVQRSLTADDIAYLKANIEKNNMEFKKWTQLKETEFKEKDMHKRRKEVQLMGFIEVQKRHQEENDKCVDQWNKRKSAEVRYHKMCKKEADTMWKMRKALPGRQDLHVQDKQRERGFRLDGLHQDGALPAFKLKCAARAPEGAPKAPSSICALPKLV